MTKVFIASDHAGFDLKKAMVDSDLPFEWVDFGTHSKDSVDYPDYADLVCKALLKEQKDNPSFGGFGVLVCGSGQGMAMRANRYSEIRAALCCNLEMVALSRQHNNANILALPGRSLSIDQAQEMLRVFADTKFEGGRHLARVAKLAKPSDTSC